MLTDITVAGHGGTAPEPGLRVSRVRAAELALFALPGAVGGAARSASHCGPVCSGFLSADLQIDADLKCTGPLQAELHWTFYSSSSDSNLTNRNHT